MSSVRHIMPRRSYRALCGAPDAVGGDHVGLVPLRPDLHACEACVVVADEAQEAGDLRVVTVEGKAHWEADDRPPEYRSADAFADYLRENGEQEYSTDDLALLVEHTRRPEAELRRVLGKRGLRPAPQQREVRGLNSYWKSGAWRVR